MTFEEYWAGVGKTHLLPAMAIDQIPTSLSNSTKKRLMRKQPEETAEMLREAIEEINIGSIESIDSLERKSL